MSKTIILMTLKQMRVCVIRAAEIVDRVDTGSTDVERLDELCNRYDAELDLDMVDLSDTLAMALTRRS